MMKIFRQNKTGSELESRTTLMPEPKRFFSKYCRRKSLLCSSNCTKCLLKG